MKLTGVFVCLFSVHRPQKTVWHGSDMSGESAVDGNCDGWNSESAYKRGLGSSLVVKPDAKRGPKLLNQDTAFDCHNFFIVLCVEVTPHSDAMFSRKRRRSGGSGRRPVVHPTDEAEPETDADDSMTPQEYEQLLADEMDVTDSWRH